MKTKFGHDGGNPQLMYFAGRYCTILTIHIITLLGFPPLCYRMTSTNIPSNTETFCTKASTYAKYKCKMHKYVNKIINKIGVSCP